MTCFYCSRVFCGRRDNPSVATQSFRPNPIVYLFIPLLLDAVYTLISLNETEDAQDLLREKRGRVTNVQRLSPSRVERLVSTVQKPLYSCWSATVRSPFFETHASRARSTVELAPRYLVQSVTRPRASVYFSRSAHGNGPGTGPAMMFFTRLFSYFLSEGSRGSRGTRTMAVIGRTRAGLTPFSGSMPRPMPSRGAKAPQRVQCG